MATSVPDLLLATLEKLVGKDLKTFHWYLTQSVPDGFPLIPKGHLENADRQDTVDTMVNTYGHDVAMKISLEILREMNQKDLTNTLTVDQQEAEVKVTAASIRVPDSPVYITCTAQTGGHVVAPSLSGCHIGGPVHFNIRVNSLDEEPIVPSQASPAHFTMFPPEPVNTEDNGNTDRRGVWLCYCRSV